MRDGYVPLDRLTRQFIERTRRSPTGMPGIPEWAIAEAEAEGIPVPFHTVEGEIAALNGRHVEVRVQFVEAPSHAEVEAIRAVLVGLLAAPVISDSLAVVRNYDPRAWRGGPPRY